MHTSAEWMLADIGLNIYKCNIVNIAIYINTFPYTYLQHIGHNKYLNTIKANGLRRKADSEAGCT